MSEATIDLAVEPTITTRKEKPKFRKTLRNEVSGLGFAEGIASAIKIHGGQIERILNDTTQDTINHKPVILLVTHNYQAEVWAALGGLPDPKLGKNFREVRQIAQAAPEGSWLNQHTFPLYNVDEKSKKLRQKVSRAIQPRETIENTQATIKNFQSLMQAAKYVANDGLVIMCPEGTRDKNDKWQTGVAALIKAAKSKLGDKDGYIIMADVSGIDLRNWIKDKASKYIPSLSPFSKTKVRYSDPIPLSEIDTSQGVDGVTITQQVENKYRDWKSTTSNPTP